MRNKSIRCTLVGLILILALIGLIKCCTNPISAAETTTEIAIDSEFTAQEVAEIQAIQSAEPERDFKYLGQFKLTAYCPCEKCSGIWGKQTKSQTVAEEGRTIAVDPDIIPLGSKVKINGKVYTAEDIGAKVKGKVIDIYFDTHAEVEAFGVRHGNVTVER